jgi:hypothetical protein
MVMALHGHDRGHLHGPGGMAMATGEWNRVGRRGCCPEQPRRAGGSCLLKAASMAPRPRTVLTRFPTIGWSVVARAILGPERWCRARGRWGPGRQLSRDLRALSRDSRALSRDSRALSRGPRALSRGSRALSRDSRALSRGSRALWNYPRALLRGS